jgi:sigma-E factor negative regulatory protein RseB
VTPLRPAAALVLLSAVGMLVLSSGAGAHAAPGSRADPADDARALALLDRAVAALEQTSYSGTRVVSSWGRLGTTSLQADLTHVAGQGTLVSIHGGGADGQDNVAFLEVGDAGRVSRSGLGVDSVGLLSDGYHVATSGRARVAGRRADVVDVSLDAVPVARLWLDGATGLPLRREVYDGRGRLASASIFVDLRVDAGAFLAHLPPIPPSGGSAEVAFDRRIAQQRHGWACPSAAGAMRLVDMERVDGSSATHLAYSDGLSRVSVFEQNGSLDEDSTAEFEVAEIGGRQVFLKEGMPTYVMWENDGTVYTVVSDAPVNTIARLVAAYPRRPAEDFWTRVGSGLARMGAWLTPAV